jgi:anti-sigma factor RsiW
MMKKSQTAPGLVHRSTELELHKYADGELGSSARAQIEKAAQKSAAIRAQINELRQLMKLVRTSYTNIRYLH